MRWSWELVQLVKSGFHGSPDHSAHIRPAACGSTIRIDSGIVMLKYVNHNWQNCGVVFFLFLNVSDTYTLPTFTVLQIPTCLRL